MYKTAKDALLARNEPVIADFIGPKDYAKW
jgi:hypothetical protein